ncbi:translocon-associated protein subunit gamma-like [Watersipora subatra]|uniref:translocon-associated protein subunit gamma-like n=1 Tax=Watersipora subatra TaxID=2589382 RepID=UPI00355AD8D5
MSGKQLTKDEELLLQDFSRNVSTKSSALFYGNALIVSAVPLWIYWRIHTMDPIQSAVLFILMTGISTYLLSFAYKNVKFILKHKAAQKVADGVSQEIMKKFGDNKKMSKKEKDERILWKKNEVADYQATNYSLFYNNAMFLALVVLASFFVFRSLSPSLNYILSMGAASGLVALVSTGTK